MFGYWSFRMLTVVDSTWFLSVVIFQVLSLFHILEWKNYLNIHENLRPKTMHPRLMSLALEVVVRSEAYGDVYSKRWQTWAKLLRHVKSLHSTWWWKWWCWVKPSADRLTAALDIWVRVCMCVPNDIYYGHHASRDLALRALAFNAFIVQFSARTSQNDK